MQLNALAGVVALVISAVTAVLLLLHVGGGEAAPWQLSRLGARLSGALPPTVPPSLSPEPQSADKALTQLLCSAAAPRSLRGRSSGSGSGGHGTNRLPLSWAAPHIVHDLRRWRHTGFERSALDELVANSSFPWGDAVNAFRFQIVAGELFMDTSEIPYVLRDGRIEWFPARTTAPGNMSITSRAPMAMLALYELLLLFPGQVPDVDAFMHFGDVPAVRLAENPATPPLFAPCSSDAHAEVPFPDWSFWKNQGWDAMREKLQVRAAKPLAERTPAVIYRGRAVVGGDDRRKAVVACSGSLAPEQQHLVDARSVTWLQKDGRVSAEDMCGWRYNIYIEAAGWSASLKSRLACGSVLLAVKPRWYEWFSRGLLPGRHYLEVPAQPLRKICPAIMARLVASEAALAPEGGRDGNGTAGGGAAGSDSGGAAGGGKRTRQPAPDPYEVAAAGNAFVHTRLRMQDVHHYMLDVLQAYATLQRFKPAPTPGAQRITAAAVLEHFLFDIDRQRILAPRPWLRCALERGL